MRIPKRIPNQHKNLPMVGQPKQETNVSRIEIALDPIEQGYVSALIEEMAEAEQALKASFEFRAFHEAKRRFQQKTAPLALKRGIQGPFQIAQADDGTMKIVLGGNTPPTDDGERKSKPEGAETDAPDAPPAEEIPNSGVIPAELTAAV